MSKGTVLVADDDAGPRRVDRNPALLVRALDDHLRERGELEAVAEVLADLEVLVEGVGILLAGGIPL